MAIPSGYTALDFVGFTDRGTYAGNVSYVRNDLVHHGGNIWLVLIDGTLGIVPSESANYTLWLGEPTNLVERIIAPLEDNPATVAYGVGRQIIFNDWLYEVIAPIAVGDALVTYESDPSNANIKLALPVETQVLAIKAEADATDAMIAPNENGSTMSQSYAIGAQFIRGNVLYKAKAAITSGTAWSSLTLNTDYEVQSDSLVEQINTKQPKTLATPITVNNVEQTTVEGALGAINTDLGSTKQALANVKDSVASISITGTTNNTGSTINKGTFFYLNGSLVIAKTSIANGATLTSGTNYETVTVGEELFTLNTATSALVETGSGTSIAVTFNKVGRVCQMRIANGKFTTTGANEAIFAIPAGFRPLEPFDFLDTYSNKRLESDNGNVIAVETLSSVNLRGSVTYITES